MPTPLVRLRSTTGQEATVPPGGIIGRMPSAALRLADPRVSEAAALVSLRGRDLHLLALRGSLLVDGVEEDDVILEPGLRVRISGAVDVLVAEVVVPDEVLVVDIPGQTRELCAPAYSLVLHPEPDLVPYLIEGAPARLWSTSEGWVIDRGQGPEAVRPGRTWEVGGLHVSARLVPLDQAATVPTATSDASNPLTLIVRTATVHIRRPRREPLPVDGIPARLLTELALMARPVDWLVVAREIWGDRDPSTLRVSWDRALKRLRARLREGGVREDLVRSDGRGTVELFLHAGDTVVDEA